MQRIIELHGLSIYQDRRGRILFIWLKSHFYSEKTPFKRGMFVFEILD